MMTMKREPNLRFPGFEGEWEEDRIKNLGKLTSGIGFSEKYQGYKNFDTNFYKVSDMNSVGNEKYMHIANNTVSDDIILSLKTKVICSPSIIFAKVGAAIFLERKRIVTKQFLIDNNMMAFTPYEVNNLEWLYYRFNSLCFSKYAQTGALPSYNASDIGNIKLSIPSLSEQQKIADCLTTMDDSIEAQQQKVEQLKEYKKGLLQQIFSQSLRFPGFEVEWEEKKLGEVCEITTGKLDANAMTEDGEYHFFTCAKEAFKIDKYAFDTEALLVSGNGANVGYIHYFDGKFNAYQRTYVLDNFGENIFYLKFFLEKYLPRRILREKNEGATPYIVLNTLYGMHIKCPDNIEQEKIADCLSTLDEVIDLESQKLEQLRQYKKGLLQQLFV